MCPRPPKEIAFYMHVNLTWNEAVTIMYILLVRVVKHTYTRYPN